MNFFKIIIVIYTLFVTSHLCAQNAKYSFVEQRKFYEIVEMHYKHGRIIVPVKINGKEYNFILDTGAPTVLDNRLVEVLNLSPEKTIAAGSSGTAKDSVGLYILPNLTISNIDFKNTLFSNADLSSLSPCRKIDGILGANLMSLCVWQIDVLERQLIVSNNIKNIKNLGTKVKMDLYGRQGSPLVVGAVNDKIEEQMLFDTGDPALFSWREAAYEIGKKQQAFSDNDVYQTYGSPYGTIFGKEPNDTINYVMIDALEIGQRKIDSVLTQVSNDNVTKFGSKFLEYFKVTLDFPKRRFYTSLHESLTIEPSNFVGFSYTVENKKVFIDEIPIDEKSINIKSEVIALNGVLISKYSEECELIKFLKDNWYKENSVMTVRLENGQIKEIKTAYNKELS